MARKYSYLEKLYMETLLGAAWFSWYDFPEMDSVLVAGKVPVAALAELAKRFKTVCQYDKKNDYTDCRFSAILIGGGLGSRNKNAAFLHAVGGLLSSCGVLLWAVDNKMGTRFLCGDAHLTDEGDYFTRREWEKVFSSAGMPLTHVYGLMPGWHMLRNVFTDECPLSADNMNRLEFRFVSPERLIRDEMELLNDIAECGGFSQVTNSFLLEYRQGTVERLVIYGDMYADKGGEKASVVLRYADGIVIKKPLFAGGSVEEIYRYGEELRKSGIKFIRQRYEAGKIIMPYIREPLLAKVMVEAAERSVQDYRSLLERYWDCILSSSKVSEVNAFPLQEVDCGVRLQKAYVDMTPVNAFVVGDDFCFFDQEYCLADYPAKFVLYRGLVALYTAEKRLEQLVSLETVKEWFGLLELWPAFCEVDYKDFIYPVRNLALYADYHNKYSSDRHIIARNKNILRRVAQIAEADLFSDMEGREVVLFGAGRYCDRFLQQHGKEHPPIFILDNAVEKKNTFKNGIEIVPPQVLMDMQTDKLRVIICNRQVSEIAKQLEDMGIEDYRVY